MNCITRQLRAKDLVASATLAAPSTNGHHYRPSRVHGAKRRHVGPVRDKRMRLKCAATSSLATYSVPLYKPEARTWFEKSVQELVLHPPSKPVLLLAYAQPHLQLRTIQLTDAQVWDPQAWPELCSKLSSTSPQLLILARPIEGPEQHCYATEGLKYQQRNGAAQQQQGQQQEQQQQQQATSLCIIPNASCMSGRLGADCCGDDSDGTDHEHSSDSSSTAGSHQHDHQHQQQHAQLPAGAPQHYGLIVQAQRRCNVEGCYVLKLSRSVDGGSCSCLHYSATKVCQGAPLQEQLLDAWLTAPQAAAAMA